MGQPSPARQLTGFLARYTLEIRKSAQAALRRMRQLVPGAVELVYDNYNALVIGFGPTEKTSDATFSVALYPRWVTLFFLKGVGLSDPDRVLRGSGNVVRHVVLEKATTLDQPAVRRLIAQALESARPPYSRGARRKLVIKSVSARQRPRTPPAKSARKPRG